MNSVIAIKWLKRIAATVVTLAAAGAFFGLPTGAVLKIQPSATWTFLIVLALALVFGRLFCECFCPLGAIQSFVHWVSHPKRHVRRVCTRLPETRAQRGVRWTVVGLCVVLLAVGLGPLAWMLTPYSIFGKALTLFTPGLVLAGIVVVCAAIGRGRFWCNWICPVGTLYSLISRISAMRHKIGPGCANCRACFNVEDDDEKDAGKNPAQGVSRREALSGVAAIAATSLVEKTTDGGLAEISLPGVPARARNVLPPGAGSCAEFNFKCVACGRCIAQCPTGVLRPSVRLANFGQPEMFFQNGFCRTACKNKCAAACPVGALVPRSKGNRKNLHFGLAAVRKDLCVRTTDGVACKACLRKCPLGAIAIKDGFPVVDAQICIGCGACEHVCAARPEPAIRVEGLERQWEFAST